ncbi:MAG: DUF1273 family protein [Ruminococcus sp.]|nr:DUF1273 family protein [Ruminococcus sp.]
MKETDVQAFTCNRLTTCCFTGHRSRDLPFGGDMRKQGMKCLASSLQLLMVEAIADGYKTFISGMSDGIDLICAQLVLELAKSGRYGDLRLVCALPYREQFGEIVTTLDKYKYSVVIDGCDEKVIVSDKADRDRYKKRNQFMVDHSSRIIGVIKEKTAGSGTLQTVNMAKRAGLEIKMISLEKNPQLYIDTDENGNADKLTLL